MEWSIEKNAYATMSPDGLLDVTSVGTEADAPAAKVSLNVTKLDGAVVSDSLTVGFYYRAAIAGDLVFNDGSYGPGLVSGKTAIGMCIWVNPNNAKDRRMVSLKRLSESAAWGVYGGMNVKFTESDGTEFSVGDTYADNGSSNQELYLAKVEHDYGPWKGGDDAPYGMRQTLLIIEYRDRVLKDAGLGIPTASAGQTEMQSLNEGMNTHLANSVNLYYYPAASLCYAYEPEAENLSSSFKVHRWYLPTTKELVELYKTSKLDSYTRLVGLGIVQEVGSAYSWSCCEGNGISACNVRMSDGYVNGGYSKNYACIARAVAAF